MSVVVFVGPTLVPDEVRTVLDADCRPPAQQGDLYCAALGRPRAIGLIDGYFDGVPAVWHKEILWAMAEGIAVFGSASMGALRAAELCAFGMRGVGRIFEDYRDGRLEDDDEVAVLHAPAELGFAPLSEPMVSIRATLVAAEAAAIISASARETLLAAAKALNYRDRTWPTILSQTAGIEDRDLAALRDWLPRGRVDAKRQDALAMLAAMSAELSFGRPAPATTFAFERTNNWEMLAERVAAGSNAADGAGPILDELRLDRERFVAVRQRATLRHLAVAEARRNSATVGRKELLDELSAIRGRLGLFRRQQFLDSLAQNQLTEAEHAALASDSVLARIGATIPAGALAAAIVAELKMSGEFAELKARAEQKARLLDGHAARPLRRGARPDDLALLVWYFERRLGRPIPDDPDGYAREIGLGDRDELYRLLEGEHVYFATQAQAEDSAAARRDA